MMIKDHVFLDSDRETPKSQRISMASTCFGLEDDKEVKSVMEFSSQKVSHTVIISLTWVLIVLWSCLKEQRSREM